MTALDKLWKKINELSDAHETLRHRLRRAASWCKRGCDEQDPDAMCIFLWIAFNAAYAIERKADPATDERERHEFYFAKLLPLDDNRRIITLLATDLRSRVQGITENMYVYRGFWDSLTYQSFDWHLWPKRKPFEWDRDFMERKLGHGASVSRDVLMALHILFDRLYVLRNQLMHGCATQDGMLNRSQVEDGAKILASLVPLFLDIMVANPQQDWGPLPYPVRDDIRQNLHVGPTPKGGPYKK